MERYEFDTASLFEVFFGYRALPYPGVIFNRMKGDTEIRQAEEYQFEIATPHLKEQLMSNKGVKYYAKNTLGNLMFMPVTLTPTGGTDILLENTVISLTCKKTIVETPLVARRGTVKEEISINDWDIDIKGIIVGQKNYPESEVDKLKELFEANEALKINNVLTSIFLNGQEKVVVKSLELGDNRGMEHVQPFTMQLVSDTEFDLYIEP